MCPIKPEDLVLPTSPPCDTAAKAGEANACEGATTAAAGAGAAATPLLHPWLKWIAGWAPGSSSTGGTAAGASADGAVAGGGK